MHRTRTKGHLYGLALVACVAACLAALGVAAAAEPGSPAVIEASAAGTPATAGTTATQLDAYLAGKGSPMAGQGAALMASGGRWQIDPRLIVAISGAESSFGAITCAPYNAWGYGCPNGPFHFSSWAEGIDRIAQGLRTDYLSEGRVSVALINLKYAPLGAANDPTGLNNNWTANVSKFLLELGADPDNVDTGGIGGTRLLGLPPALTAAAAPDAFSFEDAAAPARAGARAPAAGTADAATAHADLTVRPGTPTPLVVTVENTGTATWTAGNVRLRRTDIEARIVGAPYGALSDSTDVAPRETGKFIVPLAAAGASSGSATTTWQLEGPAGAFGGELTRTVAFAVPALVQGDARIDVVADQAAAEDDGGRSTIVVHVRNLGSETWKRDGEDAVRLVALRAVGHPLQHEGWLSDAVAAGMLERNTAPGETASFAFHVRGRDGAIALSVRRGADTATGLPIILKVGAVAADDLAQLRIAGSGADAQTAG
ncbi:MAG: conjugal transfer protein [Thermoleophilia bacterium]|nr:conjugal transfer protein [Thermoleophilia bacterium]